MKFITEGDILELYSNYEIDEADLVEAYELGFISDNTMAILEDSGIFEDYEYSDYLEEGIKGLLNKAKDKVKQGARAAAITTGLTTAFTVGDVIANVRHHGVVKGIGKYIQGKAIQRAADKKYSKMPGNENVKYASQYVIGKGRANKDNGAAQKFQDHKRNLNRLAYKSDKKELDSGDFHHTIYKGKKLDNVKDKHQVDKIEAKSDKLFDKVRYTDNITNRLKRMKGIKDAFGS